MHIFSGSELRAWHSEKLCRALVETLTQHRFKAQYCATAAEAKAQALALASNAATIGFGGSKTVEGLGIQAALSDSGAALLNHAGTSGEERLRIFAGQKTCDVFFLSANALSTEGHIVNTDGIGNRVAASIHGPKKVVFIIGRNKIVRGGIAEAIARVHEKAAPPNCFRLSRKTPCAATGTCADCNSPERICNVTVILERCPSATEIHVLLVNEDLGL